MGSGASFGLSFSDTFPNLPEELMDIILSYLSPADLCHLAMCSRGWRERTNRDYLWRPLGKARGCEFCGETFDLEVSKGFLDDMYSSVLIENRCKKLAPICKWKVIFLKFMYLETNWAQGSFHKIPTLIPVNQYQVCIRSVSRKYVRRSEYVVHDGHYLVRCEYSGGIYIWEVAPGDDLNELWRYSSPKFGLQFGTNQRPDRINSKFNHEWDVKRFCVSKGIGLAIAVKVSGDYSLCQELGTCWVATFDCRRGHWLTWFPHARSDNQDAGLYRIDGETMIGLPRGWDLNACTTFCVWSSVNGTLRHTLTGHDRDISGLNLSDDKAVSAAGNTVKFWDVNRGECLRNFECPDWRGIFSDCNLNSKYIMGEYDLMDADGETRKAIFWHLESGQCFMFSCRPRSSPVTSYRPPGQTIIVINNSGQI